LGFFGKIAPAQPFTFFFFLFFFERFFDLPATAMGASFADSEPCSDDEALVADSEELEL
jgi:hypothetical protein